MLAVMGQNGIHLMKLKTDRLRRRRFVRDNSTKVRYTFLLQFALGERAK